MRVPVVRYRDGREYRVFRGVFDKELFLDKSCETEGRCLSIGLCFQGPEPPERDPIQSLAELMSKPVGYRLLAAYALERGR